MAGHDFKKTGVLRAGFQYQDLVAIEILINFYRQRDLYAWVQLEAEDSEFRSIEDVVACRPDGLYELTQVKFTVDPAVHKLNWEWLTARKDSGTSLLQKWAHTTLHHRSSKTLASAALKTDRIPDASFMACLNCNKVDYTQLSADEKTVIDEQLGSSDRAVAFFENFEFLHSQLRLDDFEAKLRSRVALPTQTVAAGSHFEIMWKIGQHEIGNLHRTEKSNTSISIKHSLLNAPNQYRKISWCRRLTKYRTKFLTQNFLMKSLR